MIRLLVLALAIPLAACGGDSAATPSGSASATGASPDASQSAPPRSADATAANPGMSRDSLLTSRERLDDALARYRGLADGGGWVPIPDGDLVEPSDTAAAQVQALGRPVLDVPGAVDDREAVPPAVLPEHVPVSYPVHVAEGLGTDVAQPHPTDEAPPGSHAEAHGALAALLLHRPRLEIEHPAVVLRAVLRAQLFPHLVRVFRMNVVVD